MESEMNERMVTPEDFAEAAQAEADTTQQLDGYLDQHRDRARALQREEQRHEVAVAAMAAWLTGKPSLAEHDDFEIQELVSRCYRLAEAMLRERERLARVDAAYVSQR